MSAQENNNPCFSCYDTACPGITYFSPIKYTKITLLHEMGRADNKRKVVINCSKCGKPNMVEIDFSTVPYQQGKQDKPGWGHD